MIDGDSLVVVRADTGEKVIIRLFGIDCPERGQDFGNDATALTRARVPRKRVGAAALGMDAYDRTIGTERRGLYVKTNTVSGRIFFYVERVCRA